MGGGAVLFFGNKKQDGEGEGINFEDVADKFCNSYSWTLDEVEKLSFVQFTRLLNAITKREKEYWVVFATSVHNAFIGGEKLQGFIDRLQGIKGDAKVLTDNDMNEMGLGKKE